jgi:hypothetical protein
MLAMEAAIFFVAALVHFEVLFDGYLDREAGIAETVIGFVLLACLVMVAVLLTGLVMTWRARAPFHQPLDRVSAHDTRR